MMKNYRKLFIVCLTMTMIMGCGEDFLEELPEDRIALEEYFLNDDQIAAATGSMYATPWFDYISKFSYGVHEIQGGNAISFAPEFINWNDYTTTSEHEQIRVSWTSLYNVIGKANGILSALENVEVGADVTENGIDGGKAEAYFMRAIAHFYLTQYWGEVPIVYDNLAQIGENDFPKAPVADIYRFVIEDLEQAASLGQPTNPGRVTSYSAKALLSKVYLTRGTLTGDAADFQNAVDMAKDVIDNSGYGLMDDYAELWKTENDNNIESVFALQQEACFSSIQWGQNNALQAFWAYDGTISRAGDGWGSMNTSFELINAYDGDDERRKPTIMMDGDFYPELDQANGGILYNNVKDGQLRGSTGSYPKKYIVGNSEDQASVGGVCFMSTGINTPLIRFADVLLTYAEAAIGNNTSTSDAAAVEAFNQVRRRAGLSTVTSVSLDDIFEERRLEFAMEMQIWFDILRMHNRDAAGAINLLSNLDRGGANLEEDGSVSRWDRNIAASEAVFLLPYPANEVAANPKLSEAAVPFY